MTRVGSFDGEIGRGRQRNEDDSSSSRESSPAPRRVSKRSFSPLSDDGDVVIQNEDKDQTPPHAERPIIRQAVAFSDQATQVPVMTYEAKVLPPKTNHFLPGQEVPLPPKPKGTRKRAKRPRRPNAYPGQTSKFRLETYDPTPTTTPPTTHGGGPYSSLYRNVGHAVQGKSVYQGPHAEPSNCVSISGLQSASNTGSFLANHSNVPLPSSGFNYGSNVASAPFLQSTSAQRIQQVSTTNDPSPSALIPSQSLHSQSRTQSPSPRPLSTDSHSHAKFVTDTTLTIREHSSPGPYYRRNYDVKDFTPPPRDRRTLSRNTSSKSSTPDSCYPGLTHVVTLLIADVRNASREPDHQLAEVRVPLKKVDELEEGWWADARDIAEKLQAGAARIDGPARVYTLRGKYRQFILRVTADNRDEIVSANVPVSADRTLDLTVEMLHPPGISTHPQQSPRRNWSTTYDNHIQRPEERMDVDRNRAVPQSHKRRVSPSFDHYDDHTDRHSDKVRRRDRGWSRSPRRRSPSLYGDRPLYTSRSDQEYWFWKNNPSMDHRPCRRSNSPQYRSHAHPSPPPLARTPLPTVHVGPGYPRRDEGDSSDSSDEPFTGAVERLLREELEADEYHKAAASNKVCDIVKQYEIVSRMFKKWVGKRPPGFSQSIEEIHIANALEIEDSQEFISNCRETLDLLKLYGKRGRFVEDPRVISMLVDQKPPPVNSDQAKRLLRLLRGLDDAWRNGHSGPVLNGITLPEPNSGGTFDKPRPFSSSPEPTSSSKAPGLLNLMTAASPRQYSHVRPVSSTSKAVASGSEKSGSVDTPRYSSRGKTIFMD